MKHDANLFTNFKTSQKENWANFAPNEINTIIPAARLVRFANVNPKQRILDVACGTGVVGITAARLGAWVNGCDITPALIEKAQKNAEIAHVEAEFIEADVEALPYEDNSFDVVLSQYGHIFAPRPERALAEMLRVLKPGGTIAFASWPKEHLAGRLFLLVESFFPLPPGASSPTTWGDIRTIEERLGDKVTDIIFDRDIMTSSALSPAHFCRAIEKTIAPVVKMIQCGDTAMIEQFRRALTIILADYYEGNSVRSHYLLTKAIKK